MLFERSCVRILLLKRFDSRDPSKKRFIRIRWISYEISYRKLFCRQKLGVCRSSAALSRTSSYSRSDARIGAHAEVDPSLHGAGGGLMLAAAKGEFPGESRMGSKGRRSD
jgi:hypothetical protein